MSMFQLKNLTDSSSSPSSGLFSLGWLMLAIAGMCIASLYALLLVGSRAAAGMGLLTDDSLFQIALVLHVDFSIVVWFLSIAGLFWNLYGGYQHPRLALAGFSLSCTGVLMLAFSPLLSEGEPVLSDYILVLNQPLFLFALGLFAGGLALSAISLLLKSTTDQSPVSVAVRSSAWVYLAALLCLPLAWLVGPASDSLRGHYEDLFWGTGHLLQIGHTLLMLATVLLLLKDRSPRNLSSTFLLWPLRAMLVLAISGPLLYISGFNVADGRIIGFTHLMAMSGILSALFLISLSHAIWQISRNDNMRLLLLFAAGLFLAGMWLGVLIDQNNARVPAHYHAAIGGITLAFMGMVYQLSHDWYGLRLEQRLLRWQIILYGVGMTLLISGLLLADVPRKTIAGSESGLRAIAGHTLSGLGGSLALMGSVLFLWLVIRSLFANRSRLAPQPSS